MADIVDPSTEVDVPSFLVVVLELDDGLDEGAGSSLLTGCTRLATERWSKMQMHNSAAGRKGLGNSMVRGSPTQDGRHGEKERVTEASARRGRPRYWSKPGDGFSATYSQGKTRKTLDKMASLLGQAEDMTGRVLGEELASVRRSRRKDDRRGGTEELVERSDLGWEDMGFVRKGTYNLGDTRFKVYKQRCLRPLAGNGIAVIRLLQHGIH